MSVSPTSATAISAMFDRAAPLYDQVGVRQFSHFAAHLIDYLKLSTGAQVLDLACGSGALLLPAAAAVGPTGRVIGIDLAPGMVKAAAQRLRDRGCHWASVALMDANQAAFPPAAFDYLLCGFALHFLDYERLLPRLAAMLTPGGVIGLAQPYVPLDPAYRERWRWLPELTRAVFPSDFTPPAAWIAPNRLSTPAQIQPVLEAAGFVGVQTHAVESVLYFADEDDWWAWEWSQGSRFWLEGMSPEGLAHFRAESFRQLAAMKTADGIPMLLGALLVSAQLNG